MIVRSFFDTNVLVYGDDRAQRAKQQRTLDLLDEHRRNRSAVLSMQVLQEYFIVITRKLKVDIAIARRKVELLGKSDVVVPELADILAAIDLQRLHKFSFWDALIIRTAKQGGCSVIYSEDWQHGQEVDGIRIINPFI